MSPNYLLNNTYTTTKECKTSCDMTDFLLPILANCISLTTVIVMVVHITTITMGSTVSEGAFTFVINYICMS